MKNIKILLPFFVFIIVLIFSACTGNRFTAREKRIIKNAGKNKIMPLFLVSNKQDSIILYKKSKNVKPDSANKKLIKLIAGMYATANDPKNSGVGIAAPQIGVNKRVIWVQRFDKKNAPFEYYLNSEIIYYSEKKTEGKEACLSVPKFWGLVNRSDTIIIKYDLLNSKNLKDTVIGFTSVIFQHEIDHLNGILYTDRIKDKSKIFSN